MMKYITINHKNILFIVSLIFMSNLFANASQAQVLNALVDPPCESTTCISTEAILLANHADVEFDLMPVYVVDIYHVEPCELNVPDPTGPTVFRQVRGGLLEFPDTFCSAQGCNPVGTGGGGRQCVEIAAPLLAPAEAEGDEEDDVEE